jgi:hypothetical protein
MSKDALTRQRIASLEKLLKNGPADQRATVQGLIDALKGPSTATKTIPPARFPKGKKYKTEAPGDRTPLTDKQANEIKDLMTPNVGRPASNIKVYKGNNKTTWREDQILIKQREAQEALAAEKKAAKEAEKAALIARGDKPLDSRGNLVEPQRSEDALSKFPEPPPAKPRPPRKPSEESLDKLTPEEAAAKLAKYEKNVSLAPRRNKAHQKKYDAWLERRDAWRKENPIPARFNKKPQPESPFKKPEQGKTAEASDTIFEKITGKQGKFPKRPTKAQMEEAAASRTAPPAASTPKKPSTKKQKVEDAKPAETPAPKPPRSRKPKPAEETPAETAVAPAVKKPSAKKAAAKKTAAKKTTPAKATAAKKTAAPKVTPAKKATPAATAPKKQSSKKKTPAVVTYGTRKSDQFRPNSITPKRLEEAKASRAAFDAALKSGNPGRIRAARAQLNAIKKTKAFKVTAGVTVGAAGTLGVGGVIVGQAPGAKGNKDTTATPVGQAALDDARTRRLNARREQFEKASAKPKPNKKFGVAGESKFIKGRSAVRQSVIDQINKQGMTKALASVKTRKNDPEYLEAIRRYYGAKRLKQALEG